MRGVVDDAAEDTDDDDPPPFVGPSEVGLLVVAEEGGGRGALACVEGPSCRGGKGGSALALLRATSAA